MTPDKRQLKRFKGVSAEPQAIDHAAIERAIRLAVEQERGRWRQKLEKGRTRFRRMVASTGQSLGELKQLLEETERDYLDLPVVVGTHNLFANHRPERRNTPKCEPIPPAENSDGPLKLSSGERRILTALAQYPHGRSKVQVAVLTGYAAAGGGFNNYLGALRSRGLIEGDGDKLTITPRSECRY
jgi:hypothetical protein